MNGKELKRYRYNQSMTQHDLAARLSVSQNLVSMWERGEKQIPKKYKRALKVIFKVNDDPVKVKAEYEKKKELRIKVLNRINRRVDDMRELPEDDEDLNAFRRLAGGKYE